MLRTNRLLLLLAAVSAIAACTGGEPPVQARDSTPPNQTDTIRPSAPTGLSGAPMSSTAVSLSWAASSDNVGVTGYVVSRDGAQIATSAATSYVDSGLAAATTYRYAVAAVDAAGNMSPNSTSVNVTTSGTGSPPDTTPPSQPSSFTAAAAGPTTVNLSWGASTDNVGVTGYIVRRNGAQIATPTSTSFVNTGLTASTTYTYTVVARDAAGNQSSAASASVTTAPPPQANGSADLAWDPVVDPNLSGYRVYYGNAPGTYLQPLGQGVAAGNVTTFSVAGLTNGIRYYFAVTSTDTLGHESGYSNEVFKDVP